ncbi:MAG: glycosyltransferase [Rubrivivax sp.]|nr:glycosyltransferase [Rubrivivax sp.]
MADLPGRPLQPVLFVEPDVADDSTAMLRPFLAQPPVVVADWGRGMPARAKRLWGSALWQRDVVSLRAFQAQRIDLVFQHAAWYGLRFPMPTLAWIADLQHRRLPQMFSLANRLKRDLGYAALSRCATRILVSSEDAASDCARFFPHSAARLSVLPFCVTPPDTAQQLDPAEVIQLHGLPERYIYLPNQLWRHKNHLLVLQALQLLKQRGEPVVVAASGRAADSRNPTHPQHVLRQAEALGLSAMFRYLGMVPYGHVMPLIRGSAALLNPSLFEGWSTTVEEGKALGVPLLLSALPVHREQAAGRARFFDAHSADELAACLAAAWHEEPPAAARLAQEHAALTAYGNLRLQFAKQFAEIVAQTASQGSNRYASETH